MAGYHRLITYGQLMQDDHCNKSELLEVKRLSEIVFHTIINVQMDSKFIIFSTIFP